MFHAKESKFFQKNKHPLLKTLKFPHTRLHFAGYGGIPYKT